MKRFITTLLSTVLFAVLYAGIFYVPSSERVPTVYYFGFWETFVFVVIYAVPFYLIGSIPISIFLDRCIEQIKNKSKRSPYFIGLGIYGLAGSGVGLLSLILFYDGLDIWGLLTLAFIGIIASMIYYHLSLFISKINDDLLASKF